MNTKMTLSLFLATCLAVPMLPGRTHQVAASSTTTTRAVYKLVDVDPENNQNRYSQNRMDLRIVRNEAFDSLVNASKIIPAATDGVRGGEYDGSSGCALMMGDLWCWGDNTFGRLGDGSTNAEPEPKLVLSGVKDVFSSTRHTCAVLNNGDLVCAGGSTGYLSGFLSTFSSPIATGVQSISDAGWPCITKLNNRLYCAGSYRRSQGYSDRFVPIDWTWEDTGLLSSGEIVDAPVLPTSTGEGFSFNTWDLNRTLCALFMGQVSCVVMNPNTRGSSIPTFTAPSLVGGLTNITNIFMKTEGSQTLGHIYVYADGLLYKSNYNLSNISPSSLIPTSFQPVGSMDKPLGLISTPLGTGSIGSGFVLQSGIGTLDFDPVTKFAASTKEKAHTVLRVTAQTSLFQIIPMEVSSDVRISRENVRLRVLAGANPVVGATVTWKTADLGEVPNELNKVPLTTDINGSITLPTVMTGPVTFEVNGGVNGSAYLSKSRATVSIGESGEVTITLATPSNPVEHTITVMNENGQPVPSAVVTMANLFRTNQTTATSNGASSWSTSKPVDGYVYTPKCPHCFASQISLITGEDGKVTFNLYRTTQRWPIGHPASWVFGDFIVSYNDGVADVSTIGTLNSTNEMVKLPLQGGVSLTGGREVTSVGTEGAKILVNGVTAKVVMEEICDVLVTGGLWLETSKFYKRSCSSGAINKASVDSKSSISLKCNNSPIRARNGRVRVCPKRSMFVRLRVPGKTGTKGVCVMVAKKPCVTKQSVRYGVPKVLQIGKSVSLMSLVPMRNSAKLTASVTVKSRSFCKIVSKRLLAKKIEGECVVTVSVRNKNRVFVYDVPVLIAR